MQISPFVNILAKERLESGCTGINSWFSVSEHRSPKCLGYNNVNAERLARNLDLVSNNLRT